MYPFILHLSDFLASVHFFSINAMEKIGQRDRNFPIYPSYYFHSIGPKNWLDAKKTDPFFACSCEGSFILFVHNRIHFVKFGQLVQKWHFIKKGYKIDSR
jgi:hypothetical protein